MWGVRGPGEAAAAAAAATDADSEESVDPAIAAALVKLDAHVFGAGCTSTLGQLRVVLESPACKLGEVVGPAMALLRDDAGAEVYGAAASTGCASTTPLPRAPAGTDLRAHLDREYARLAAFREEVADALSAGAEY